MTALDITILFVIFVSAFLGARCGFVLEFTRLIAIILSVVVATRLSGSFNQLFIASHLPPVTAQVISFIILFVAVTAAGFIVAYFLHQFVEALKVKGVDSFLGCALGIIQGFLICAIALILFVSLMGTRSRAYVERGLLTAPSINVAERLFGGIPGAYHRKGTALFSLKEKKTGK